MPAKNALKPSIGRSTYLARLNGNDVYFDPGMFDRVKRRQRVLKDMIGAMQRQPGIATDLHVGRTGKGCRLIGSAAAGGRTQLRAEPQRRPDHLAKPGWMFAGAGTTHGSAPQDDQRVPVHPLRVRASRPGRYDSAASPADIAPTLATLAGVALPKAEGRPLKEALR